MPTYVRERQVEYWTSRGIEDFFLNSGFTCVTYPVHPLDEAKVPADFIYGIDPPTKVFGLQYKVLYYNGGDAWHLDSTQHGTLGQFSWIYYGLSDLTKVQDFRHALYALRIKDNNFPFQPLLPPNQSYPYLRWWSFFVGLLTCNTGQAISSQADLRDLFSGDVPQRLIDEVVDLFVVSLQGKQLVHFSSAIRPEQEDRQ